MSDLKDIYQLYVTKKSLLSPDFRMFVISHDQYASDGNVYCIVTKPDVNITRGCRNLNPFNIRKSGSQWLGKKKESFDGAFEQFESLDYGIRAGMVLFRNYYFRYRLMKIRELISRFAPSCENDVDSYVNFVSDYISSFGIHPNSFTLMPGNGMFRFFQAVLLYESRCYVPISYFKRLWQYFEIR